MRRREGRHQLGAWRAQADESEVKEIHTFANGFCKDLSTVIAGLTLPLSSGALEANAAPAAAGECPAQDREGDLKKDAAFFAKEMK
ncbi:hypothetical protein ACFXDJ_03930 [Streptomyces sp. NPDC059443]|uniref:hypothetical protein n=1 Tax=unclassified Streptomyces TaxID=2593676 RepID=UPI0036949854